MIRTTIDPDTFAVKQDGRLVAVALDMECAKRVALALDLVDGITTDNPARLVASEEAREAIEILAETKATVAKFARHGGGHAGGGGRDAVQSLPPPAQDEDPACD